MNRSTARALMQDAYYQVLDNKVFRLLVILAFLLVLTTFLIGFREDGIHLLFGWRQFSYEQLFSSFGPGQLPQTKDLQVQVIQGIQRVFVQQLAGTIGILFCIAATAFFVPRMLERGAADTLFSKPVSRPVLLLSRYFAGILFVTALACLLVLGMHVGLLVTSGYSDPGFLWSALTLVYVYALVQTVSVVVAVVTRSSVGAILSTLLFFTFNGCVHAIWVQKEWSSARDRAQAESGEEVAKTEATPTFFVIIRAVFDGLHYTLPKTHDADVLTRKLRTVVVGREFVLADDVGKIAVNHDPEGFSRAGGSAATEALEAPAAWTAVRDGVEQGRLTLSRRNRVSERPAPPGAKDPKPRISRQSTYQAASEFMKSLEAAGGIADKPTRSHEASVPIAFEIVRWIREDSGVKSAHERVFFSMRDWMFEVDVAMRADWMDEESRQALVARFLDGIHPTEKGAEFVDRETWYDGAFDWSAEFKFNAFASILSSLVFAGLMLGIAAWRLQRIEF